MLADASTRLLWFYLSLLLAQIGIKELFVCDLMKNNMAFAYGLSAQFTIIVVIR